MTERERIVAFLRHLARTATSEQARGAYTYAADEIESGRHLVSSEPAADVTQAP